MSRSDLEATQGRIAAFIAEREGLAPDAVQVTGLERLAGGASRLLWSFDCSIARPGETPEPRALVLRQDPPGRVAAGVMELEFELLKAAAGQGVPVPAVYWYGSNPAVVGAPFFAMDRIEGESIPRRLLRDDEFRATRAGLTAELGAHLARIHAIDTEVPALRERLTRPEPGQSPAQSEIERLSVGARQLAVEPHPVLDLAERWLRERVPDATRQTLVHGDYRVGNLIFDKSGTRAILDWELAHVGDPVEDLGWLCVRAWRFGNDDQPVGGVGQREELIAAYEGAGGDPVDPEALRFWEACGNFKLAVVFITQARAYLDGAHPTVELASLGRRTAEPEAELLRFMEESP
ncbi:MAG: phosphotransferase family protein [Myxococcota bacterium]